MTTITWKGEDTEDYAGPSFTIWGDRKFPKDKPVEVVNPEMIRRARNNRFFRVDDGDLPAVNESAGALDSVSSSPSDSPPSPVQKRGPGRPPAIRSGDD